MPVTDEILVFALGPLNDMHLFRVALGMADNRTLKFLVYEYGKDTPLDLSGCAGIRLAGSQVLGEAVASVDVSMAPAWSNGRVDIPVSPDDFTASVGEFRLVLSAYKDGKWFVLGNGVLDVAATGGMTDLPLPNTIDLSPVVEQGPGD